MAHHLRGDVVDPEAGARRMGSNVLERVASSWVHEEVVHRPGGHRLDHSPRPLDQEPVFPLAHRPSLQSGRPSDQRVVGGRDHAVMLRGGM